MPEKVPLWVVQNTFATFGQRMPPRGKTLPDDLKVCATCLEELYDFQDWHYCGEKYYCTDHIQAARQAQNKIWEEERLARKSEWERSRGHGGYTPAAAGLHIVPATEASVPKGNLDEGMYQYWIGALDETMPRNIMSTRSICRACGATVYGAMGRAIHKNESARFYREGYSCMKVISMVIREMAALSNCLVCHTRTIKKHYGVPICSPNCHKIWRFNEDLEYPELELAIMKYWIGAPETGGSSTSESSSKPIPIVLQAAEEE